jgi:hypothetical protein
MVQTLKVFKTFSIFPKIRKFHFFILSFVQPEAESQKTA